MKKILIILIGCVVVSSPAFCASELSRIQTEIKQVEQKNKKLAEQVKKSDKNVAQTKQDLVRTAEQVSNLEEQRGKMQNTIIQIILSPLIILAGKREALYILNGSHMEMLTRAGKQNRSELKNRL